MSKTNYIRVLADNYCVLDTETTGLSAEHDKIIEIGMLRVRDNIIVDRYSQLINPHCEISAFITRLTGITDEMLQGMPSIEEVRDEVLQFIGNDIIIGHHTSFDVRFVNKNFGQIQNHYVDTLQFSKKIYPELKHHKLKCLTTYLKLHNNEHRALSDCISTKELYDSIKRTMDEKGLTIDDLWSSKSSFASIKAECDEIDENNFFFNKQVVFTGKLEKMVRKVAMQNVVNRGGTVADTLTQKTNCLVLANEAYNTPKKNNKQVRAEKLILDGQELEIIDEFTFYSLIEEN